MPDKRFRFWPLFGARSSGESEGGLPPASFSGVDLEFSAFRDNDVAVKVWLHERLEKVLVEIAGADHYRSQSEFVARPAVSARIWSSCAGGYERSARWAVLAS